MVKPYHIPLQYLLKVKRRLKTYIHKGSIETHDPELYLLVILTTDQCKIKISPTKGSIK